MTYTAAELETDAGRKRFTDYLDALRRGDRILTILITWWCDGEEIDRWGPIPAHLAPGVPPMGGATHLTVEEREVPL